MEHLIDREYLKLANFGSLLSFQLLWRLMIEPVTSCGDGHSLWCSIVVYIVL
ncbi:hypothetical protein I3843_01G167400 [Carya illinoinensis]|nr:hypothetical protein I3843_01G167400 [Carya illinoinensis]